MVEEEEEAPDTAGAVPTLAVPVVAAAAVPSAAAADVRGAALALLLAAAAVTCPDPSMSADDDEDVLDILLASFDAISCACLGNECFLQKILNSPPHPFPWSSTTWKPARIAQDTCMVWKHSVGVFSEQKTVAPESLPDKLQILQQFFFSHRARSRNRWSATSRWR